MAARRQLGDPVLVRRGRATLWKAGQSALRVADTPADVLVRRSQAAAAIGVRCARPDAPLETHGQYSVSSWQWEATIEPGLEDFAKLGTAIGQLHEEASAEAFAVKSTLSVVHMLIDERVGVLDDLPAEVSVPIGSIIDRVDDLFGRASCECEVVVCHGDLHRGNVLWTAHGPVLCDWELAGIGPAWWELVPLAVECSRFGDPWAAYDRFISSYGDDPRGHPVFDELCVLIEAIWTLGAVRDAKEAGPESWVAGEAARRVASWIDPAIRWQPR